MKIFVGNLSFKTTEVDVKKAFEEFGSVSSVAIVMDRKGISSRGFGFVEMPDDQQAQAVIAAFDGKDFMGRPLNVGPARLKIEKSGDRRERRNMRVDNKAQSQEPSYEQKEDKKNNWFSPDSSRSRRGYSPYKKGRRSRSYMMRRAVEGVPVQDKPRMKSHENPMRWRKKKYQPKPWQKAQGESKPWGKSEGQGRHWERKEGEGKPWQKSHGESKPWEKGGETYKPWKKKEGESKTWRNKEADFKPWRKTKGKSPVPWRKNNQHPQGSRFKSRRKPGKL